MNAGPTGAIARAPELRLLPEQWSLLEQPSPARAAAGTAAVHLLLIGGLLLVARTTSLVEQEAPLRLDLRNITPLVAPPAELTQRAPNRGPISRELDLEGLRARAPLVAPQAPPLVASRAAERVPPPPPPLIQEPPLLAPAVPSGVLRADLPAAGQATAPPQIQAQERPKLAFEKPGGFTAPSGPVNPSARLPMPPAPTVEDAIRGAARQGPAGGIVVGDLDLSPPGLAELLRQPSSPGRTGSTLELLSDPMGVDFRPYLVRILSTVKRNWLAVIPESVKFGRRGRVLLQFAIHRSGNVPKLVIALGSGTEALDRAAVAGVSASNPFPPLPPEFRGDQIRLQFAFSYNMPSR